MWSTLNHSEQDDIKEKVSESLGGLEIFAYLFPIHFDKGKKRRYLTMGVYLVALTVGVPCMLFLLYCTTPNGKNWMRHNNLL